jgi:hypothetical protein
MMYTMIPGKAALKNDMSTYSSRTMVGSTFRFSAIPPQTPAIIRLLERRNPEPLPIALSFPGFGLDPSTPRDGYVSQMPV